MKQLTSKIKTTLKYLIVCLIVFVSFSATGILFTIKGNNSITVSTSSKTFDTSKYSASVAALSYDGESVSEVGKKLNKKFKGSLKGTGEYFAKLCMEKGMDPYLLAAISVHETAFGTSSAAVTRFNYGGIMCNGKLCEYDSVEHGLTSFINMVYRNYFKKGLLTPEQMHKKYAASPTWAEKVNSHYKALKY